MKKQVETARMIGGPGWSAGDVTRFFDGREFYGIPCSAIEKDGDPLGRIVHDYGFYILGSYSVNATHSCTRVIYHTTQEVTEILDGVK